MSHLGLSLAQTGRSTRMRERAVELAIQGRAVYILVPTRQMVKLEQKKVQELWDRVGPSRHHGIKVEAFDEHWAPFWNWEEMKPKGEPNPNCEFLMDHYVVEMHIRTLHARIESLVKLTGSLYPYTV